MEELGRKLINIFEAILLGVIQGITEFLPISSDGHLVIFQNLLGLKEPEFLFDILLHGGTLLATLLLLWKEFFTLLKTPRAMLLIIAGCIPTALMGLFLVDIMERFWTLKIACTGLLITGTYMWFTHYVSKERLMVEETLFSTLTIPKAFLIGATQGLALFPGVSRSALTITTALLLKSRRNEAVTFSFLLSIPSIMGAIGLKLYKTPHLEIDALPMLGGFLTAFIIGLPSLWILIKIVRQGSFFKFSYYCWIVGLGGLLAAYTLL